MAFAPKTQVFGSRINEVTIGVGDKSTVIGGVNVLPFYNFDEQQTIQPKIGAEISDLWPESFPAPGIASFYAGCTGMAEMAKRAETIEGVSFLCLAFEGADPNGLNKSVADCVAQAKEVAAAVEMPLVIMGCKNVEKDAELFSAMAEALQSKNVLILSAREENYKTVGASVALAYGHKVGAESAVDLNLAKQLNVIMTQLGVKPESMVMNVGSAAAGYGFEYLSSTLDRVRATALEQGDEMLQMPIVTPVSSETWSVKESMLPESEAPEWGCAEERGIEMEITTASACLAGGSDAVILAHPESIAAIHKMITALM